ncbi:erythroblast NAD(P)(+)--arginine ADP-ribosyltransferase-like [Sylvia atricapilla]|uniref:erythroblast NAD(P)(+)--arginine ADP-ribosyltransferase-like n=1 Tax=Sylvia atricapilla TaxID=48155 RepID=UPI0033944C73
MAALAHTLALLAMAVATVANEVKPLDMAGDSFDDQYQGCGSAMTAALPALNRSEFQKNPFFAKVWAKAAAKWQKRGPPESPLSPTQATAIVAFTMEGLHIMFNNAVRVAGRSAQDYRYNFHYKTFHFLLTDALTALRDALKGKCTEFLLQVCRVQFKAERGNIVRFGEFASMSARETAGKCSGKETLFQVYTCQGVDIAFFSDNPHNLGVLIPPFETFEVTQVTESGDKAVIQLHSTGTSSKYNCEWLKGGTVSKAPFHLGGLLLATTALAVVSGIL